MSRVGIDGAERRAQRLVRLYPPAWRRRYGDEFTQFLVDDITERPFAPARGLDVVRGGLRARMTSAGVAGDEAAPSRQMGAGLALLGLAGAVFMAFGVAVWSQLTVSWQWAAPPGAGTRAGMYVMSAAVLALAGIAALGALPLLWSVARAALRAGPRHLAGPLCLAGGAAGVLVLGALHFGHGWPGTGGHAWAGRGLVPGAVAQFGWAATLWVSAYWAHPVALAAFPAGEVGWMAASPVALGVMLAALGVSVARAQVSTSVLRFEARLGPVLAAVMLAFLAGAMSWLASAGGAPHGLFRTGLIDVIAVLAMAGALTVAWHAAARCLSAARRSATLA